MTTYPQYFTNNGVGCVSVDGLVRCGLGELGIDLVKNPDSNAESFTLRTTDMVVEYNFNFATSTTSLADIATIGNRLSSVVSPPDVNTLQVEDAVQIQGTSNSIILSASAGVNQLLINDGAGENGMFLASGGADGGIYWTTGGGEITPSLAEVLAVSPAGEGNANQSIKLSRDVDGTHPYGIDVILNGGGGGLSTSYQLTATENENYISGSLYPNIVFMENENNTDPAVKNTLQSRLYADELSLTSQTGDPAVIQYDTMTLTHNSLTFNAQLGEADPIGLSLDSAKIGLISGGNTSYGEDGQVLTSGGELGTLTWTTINATTPSLADVLAVSPEGVANDDQSIYLSRSADEGRPNGIQTILNGGGGNIQLACQFAEIQGQNFQDIVVDYTGTLITSENNTGDPVISTSQLQSTELRVNTTTPTGSHIVYKEALISPSSIHLTTQQDEDDADGIYIDPLKIGLKLAGVLSYGEDGQVLTSGSSSGSLSWTTPPSAITPSLADVLAVSPAGEASNNQEILLTTDSSPAGAGTMLLAPYGIVQEFGTDVEGVINLHKASMGLNGFSIGSYDNQITPITNPIYETSILPAGVYLTATTGDPAVSSYVGLEMWSAVSGREGFAIDINGSYGEEGYVLTSGGTGSITWSPAGGSQNLASVLAVGSVADLDQSITLSTTSTAEKTNVLDGTGMVVDNVETIDGDTIESKCEISDTLARFSTFNSAQIPSPSIPTYSSLLQADSLVLTDNKYIDSAYITHTLTLEPARIGIDGDFGEIGQVLGKDEDNNPAWITGGGGGSTTLEEAITNGSGYATSSFQIQQIESPNYAEMANDGFVVQNVDNGPLFPPIPTTTTSTLSPASLVLVSAVSGSETKTTTIGVDKVSYRTSTNDYEAEYEEDHMRVWLSGKGTPIYTTIYPNEITLYDDTFAMSSGGTLKIGRNKFEIGNDAGSAGQVIGKDENNDLAWITAGGGGSQNLASVLDVEPAGLANLGQNINIPAGDIAQYIGVNSFMSGDALYISANETSTPNEITDYTGFNIEGFSTFRIDTISDPQTQVQTDMTPASTNIKNISGDPSTTATQLLNTQNATSITIQSDSIVSSVSTTDKSAILTADSLEIQDFSSEDLGVLNKNSLEFTHTTESETDTSILLENGESPSLTLTYNFYSEDPVITSTNVISSTTMVITDGNIPQTTTFSATGMGTGSTTQPLNINAPFTLVSPVIDTPDLPLCYTPYAGYGDALIVYNNVGVVPEVSAGYAEVIFQNISATSQSSNITAICESDGDYMTMGQVSQTATNLYDTLFEIRGAGYMSSTGHQIIGANSAGSADKSVVIAYGNGAGGFQVSPSGAIGFDATPNIVDDVVSLQNAEFGTAGQFLISQGNASPPVWTSPSTQQIVSTSGNVNSTLSINSVIGVVVITPTAGTASGRTFNLPNPPPPVGYVLSVNNLSGVAWTLATTETNGYLLAGTNRASTFPAGINASGVLRYLGNIDFSGTSRPCWSL